VQIAYAIADCDYRGAVMTDYLANTYPALARHLDKLVLADLPTPVLQREVSPGGAGRVISIKCDNLTNSFYGGNKLRKLEYLLRRALSRNVDRVATFGTAASNHALATTLYAKQLGLPCICLTSHQAKTAAAAKTLRLLLANDAEIVRYGGSYRTRVATMRHYLQGRNAGVIPLGGSSWLGTVGYVNAGLELAAQIAALEIPAPDRIYIATGTMGSAAGLALGLALAEQQARVQAVRVSPEVVMNRQRLDHLLAKTTTVLNRIDASIPADLASRVRIDVRHEFFGEGYAVSNAATDEAVEFAADYLELSLEPTYTGKAMAAMLHDMARPELAGESMLFWNTYNSNPLPEPDEAAVDMDRLPAEFLRYFD
jgi:D-cysteine desulfhydrase